MNNSQLINQTSGAVEYYTPLEIVAAARNAMAGIDLDPASSEIANLRIKAKSFFSMEDDGMSKTWVGKVWLNHPFGKISTPLWMEKLVSERVNYECACSISFAATSEKWFRPLLKFPQCFIYGRTNYFLPDGTQKMGASKGSVVTYVGNHPERFYSAFKHLGEIKTSYLS